MKMSSVKLNTLGKVLNISSIFLLKISPAGAAPNGNHLYLNLPKQHTKAVRYDDLSSSVKL